MNEFFSTVFGFIREFWPIQIVEPWQRGVRYRLGRCLGVVPPGWYFVFPFADRITPVNMVPAPIFTPRQDITLASGRVVSFVASALAQVTDPERVMNGLDNYTESCREMLSAVLADKLAAVDEDRLAPEKRGRLLADLTRWADEEVSPYGLTITKVRFATFVSNARAIRLMQDSTQALGEW